MNLDNIQLFILVYKAKSFASVAKELNVAPSSVSRAIAGLEEQLQARLFQRTTRTLTPTQLGENYFHRVEALIDELELARDEVFNQNSEPFGKVKVTASTSFGQKVLSPILNGFFDRYPKVRLDLVLSDTQVNVIDDRFDLAIRHGALRDSSMVAKKLIDVNYVLVASPNYLARSAKIEKPRDILAHRLISFAYSSFNTEWNFKKDELLETIPIEPILTMTTASAIQKSVESDTGIALLPDWAVKDELRTKKLISILPSWKVAGKDFDASIWLVYPSRRFLPVKTRAFIDYLLNNVKVV
ncbi:LysR family transcriptional regulator [Bacterioplanes sanyensis]|uniref:LysR family transcriptional regulator n=1 Tax=Bacterioplanes sanyensis TaxID=1249553 RepID=A0A222FJ21_9GAMM|nr:LysR family transcriptional regulator [Bacterioplanes sanyensis]ASP38988.1 LysR family transcriptional regulator [Bacterioplanes sanyensis]